MNFTCKLSTGRLIKLSIYKWFNYLRSWGQAFCCFPDYIYKFFAILAFTSIFVFIDDLLRKET